MATSIGQIWDNQAKPEHNCFISQCHRYIEVGMMISSASILAWIKFGWISLKHNFDSQPPSVRNYPPLEVQLLEGVKNIKMGVPHFIFLWLKTIILNGGWGAGQYFVHQIKGDLNCCYNFGGGTVGKHIAHKSFRGTTPYNYTSFASTIRIFAGIAHWKHN